MLNIFKSKNKSTDFVIEINGNDLFINDKKIELPTEWQNLNVFFGEPNEVKKTEVFWKTLGISTSASANGTTNHITFHTAYNEMEITPKAEQQPFFSGKFIVDGKELSKNGFNKIERRKYEVSSFAYPKGAKPCLITVAYNQIFDPDYKKPTLTKDKYTIKPLNEPHIEFKDFGFKLAIVQELMYRQELLQPKFDLYEFVDWYDKRKIDIEEEGYEPIPEVTQYFKDLPVPQRLAPQITEIYQDGGNDIYLQLLRFGEGYEEYWDIETTEDAKHFPNLKKATLCYAKDNVVNELTEMGIDADWL